MRIRKVVKKIFLILILLSCINNVYCLENPAAISPKTQGDTFILPPVRRIAIDLVETNIDKFRVFMRKQDRLLYGVPAFPFNEQDIQRMLAEDVADEIKNTGRFWNLSLTEFVKLIPMSGNQENFNNLQKTEKLKRRLENDYNIEAWIKPSVYFAPDQTLVRVVLKGPGINSSVWAREDITLEPQANEEKIKNSFSQALARLINTMGHDGKITYIRENLLTIDFGLERGIVRGEKLFAGFIILTSFHPQTGEFLRSQRIPIHELKVMESRQGSSLCQIVASDRLAFEQALKLLGTNDVSMLVWRQTKNNYKDGWREPYNPDTAPILGAADIGFGIPITEKETPESVRSIIPPVIFENENKNNIKMAQGKETQLNNKTNTERQGLPYQITPKEENTPNIPVVLYKRAIINKPETWAPYSALIGSGITVGTINSSHSTFPNTLLNKLSASSYIDLDSKFEFKLLPYAQFSYFSGNDLSGNSFYLGATFFDTIVHTTPNDSLSIGGSLEYMDGNINFGCDCLPSVSLTHPSVFANVMWEDKIPTFGNYNIIAGLSLIDFVQQAPVWSLKGNIRPFATLPKELVFDIGLKRFTSGWIEFSIGASWDFISEYNYLKPIL